MWRAIALSLLVALAVAGSASAALTVDVRERASLVLVGERTDDMAGASVAPAGDVNGDGRADMIVGAPLADPRGRDDAGAAYVIFGPAPRGRLDLGALGRRGFRIDGAEPLFPGANRYAGQLGVGGAGALVTGAGDVNGDGLSDLVVAGASIDVVFGKRDTAPVDLAAPDAGSYRIGAGPLLGVWPVGDVNGDGRSDLAINVEVEFDENAGALAVVYGKADPAPVGVDLVCGPKAGAWGFGVTGGADMDLGRAAASAGDVNRDGIGDLLVGAPDARSRGAVFVLFGRRDPFGLSITPGRPFGGVEIRAPRGVAGFGSSLARYRRGFVTGVPGRRAGVRPGTAWIVRHGRAPVRLGAPQRQRRLGFAVHVPGDVMGGPRAEVLVATRAHEWRPTRFLLLSPYGRRRRSYRGTKEAAFVHDQAVGVGNVGGTLRPDLLFGSPGAGRAYLLTRP